MSNPFFLTNDLTAGVERVEVSKHVLNEFESTYLDHELLSEMVGCVFAMELASQALLLFMEPPLHSLLLRPRFREEHVQQGKHHQLRT